MLKVNISIWKWIVDTKQVAGLASRQKSRQSGGLAVFSEYLSLLDAFKGGSFNTLMSP